MHPCSFSNGGTINFILTLTLTLKQQCQRERTAFGNCTDSEEENADIAKEK